MFTVNIPFFLMNSFVPSRGSTSQQNGDFIGSPTLPSSDTIGISGVIDTRPFVMTSFAARSASVNGDSSLFVSKSMSPDLLYTPMMAWPASTASSVTASKSIIVNPQKSWISSEDFSKSALAPSERLKKNGSSSPTMLCREDTVLAHISCLEFHSSHLSTKSQCL